jgi:hypothetical protein
MYVQVRILGAHGHDIPTYSVAHVVSVADHKAKSEELIVLKDVKD